MNRSTQRWHQHSGQSSHGQTTFASQGNKIFKIFPLGLEQFCTGLYTCGEGGGVGTKGVQGVPVHPHFYVSTC